MNFQIEVAPDSRYKIRRRICDRLRRAIRSGELPCETKLPPTSDLATLWGTNVATVQSALSQLVKEGLLSRTPRRGTFVRTFDLALKRVGIYIIKENALNLVARYSQEVVSCLAVLAAQLDIECTLLIDMRHSGNTTANWEVLEATLKEKDIQGIIAITPDNLAKTWLEGLNLPTAYHTSRQGKTNTFFDSDQLMKICLSNLQNHHCKKVALLLGYSTPALVDAFKNAAASLNLQVDDEHVIYPPASLDLNIIEHWGYEKFRTLMESPNPPDGLIIYDDVVARGAIMAAMEMQLDIPKQLRLVIHRCAEIPFLCPVAASFVEASCAEVAAATMQQLQRCFRGEPTKTIIIPYRQSTRR